MGIAWPCVGAFADDLVRPPSKSLLQLSHDFVQKVGNDLSEADLYLSGAGKLELAEHRAQTVLPDNEPLLLHGILGKNRVSLQQDIYSLKRGHKLLMSLSDFCSATGLAITVKAAQGTASGWFVRQNQIFSLDAKTLTVINQGKKIAIKPADIDASGNDILVSTDALEKWFGLDFNYDFAGLAVLIASEQILPAEAAYERAQKGGHQNYNDNAAKLPLYEEPYGMLTQPYIDTNINSRVTQSPGNAPVRSGSWSSVLSGDVAGMNAQGFLSGNLQKPYLDSARITLGKQDADARLLGPLHATSYQIGDVDTVNQPLIGGGAQEQGVSISSRPLFVTSDTSTQIRGNAQPGWDVELYRNDAYLDIRHVDSTGLYNFENVDLVEGDNDFKLLFYGPQGELHEEHRHIGVNPTAIRSNTSDYAVSVTRNNVTTWQTAKDDTPGTGAPHVVANYEYGINGLGTVNFGARGNNDNGTYRGLAQAGLASYLYGTFLNANVGVDPVRQAVASVLTARRNFYKQSLLLQYTRNSEEYNPSSATASAALWQSIRTDLSGPIPGQLWMLNRTNYDIGAMYSDLYSGGGFTNLNASLSTNIGSTLLSAGAQYNHDISPDNTDTETASSTFGARGFALGGVWRLGSSLDLLPKNEFREVELEYDHPIGPDIDTSAQISYTPQPPLTTASLGVNWRTSKATISPSIQADSAHNVRAGVNVHFGLGADPFTHDYNIYNKYLSATGGVAARIFLDKNGNGIYDEGDELMPEVEIRAVQEHRYATSNDKGIAFIPDLEQNRLTDIIVDSSTFKDSYNISLFDGVSVRPRAGDVVKLEFPVVVAGEMDGQADYIDEKGTRHAAHTLNLKLVAPDGRVEKTATAASDGYWSISTIRPGFYYLTTEANDSVPGYMMPRPIEFKADGSTYFGQSVVLRSGHAMPFRFVADNKSPDGPNHTRVIKPTDLESQRTALALGPFHSRLALTFAWYKFKLRASGIAGLFNLATPLPKTVPDAKTGLMAIHLNPKKPMSMIEAAETCQSLEALQFDCSVDVITKYRNTISSPVMPSPESAAIANANNVAWPVPIITKPAALVAARPVETPKAPTVPVLADISDYAAANPALNRGALKDKTVVLNLGSYNSRALMAVIWYKLKTRYTAAIGNAQLLVQPADSYAVAQTGKHVLRAALPVYDIEDATARCRTLAAAGQYCAVEIVQHQQYAADVQPKG